jgi:hypothetical protein
MNASIIVGLIVHSIIILYLFVLGIILLSNEPYILHKVVGIIFIVLAAMISVVIVMALMEAIAICYL